MTSDRWKQIETLFHQALKKPVEERSAFLDSACGDDSALRAEVQTLLKRDGMVDFFDGSSNVTAGSQLGDFEILSLLGKGGMGEVWRARDTKLGRQVAIKTLPGALARDPDRLSRFGREAKLLASLNHPHIAVIHGLEESEGTRFLVLELIEGQTLDKLIEAGAVSVESALKIGEQIAEALGAAHAKGVVHRDLKPANIKVTREGTVKVLDFGLAKAVSGDGSEDLTRSIEAASLTQKGTIQGTPAYMSPEQARGEPLGVQADIWAFGCILFELLTGVRAFEGKTVSDILAGVLRGQPKWDRLPPNLHPRLRLLLERCLEKELANRYHDIADARVDIRYLLEGEGRGLMQPVEQGRARGSRWISILGFVVVGVITGVAVWNLKPGEHAPVARLTHELADGQTFENSLGFLGRGLIDVSPDGETLVYNTEEGLYLKSLDDWEVQLLYPGEDGISTPFFSPDGEWVGYYSVLDGGLWKISVDGGTPTRIVGLPVGPFGASWAVDDTILFDQGKDIMRVSANGGQSQILVAGTPAVGLRFPQLLPGGDAVLFQTTDGAIAVEVLETHERKELVSGLDTDRARPRYLPTGHLVYATRNDLFAIAFDPETLETRGSPVSVVGSVRGGVSEHFTVSDTGTLVYLSEGEGSRLSTLAFADLSGEVERIDLPADQYRSPRICSDGIRIAVEIVGRNGDSSIWIYNRDGSGGRRLTLPNAGSNTRPLWTPDCDYVTFSSDREGSAGIWWQKSDGSEAAQRLTTAEEGFQHFPQSWSPDGVLAFERHDSVGGEDAYGIWTYSLESLESQEFYDLPGTNQFAPAFAPDGKWIAFSSAEGGEPYAVYVQPFPPPSQKQLVAGNLATWKVWSRAGNIFYRPALVTPNALRRVDIRTEPALEFSEVPGVSIEGFLAFPDSRSFDVTPEGDRLLMILPPENRSAPASQAIDFVLNWDQELLERVPVD